MRGWRRLAVLIALILLVPTPSPALPPGPPEVSLVAIPLDEPHTFRFRADATDPDGGVTVGICVDDPPNYRCSVGFTGAGDPLGPVKDCVNGGSHSHEVVHRFALSGVYVIKAFATGGGCPVLGSEETVETEIEIVVTDAPPPPDPAP